LRFPNRQESKLLYWGGAVATTIIIIMRFFNPLKLFPEFHRVLANGVGTFVLPYVNDFSLMLGGSLH
jgi:hypothetical protein